MKKSIREELRADNAGATMKGFLPGWPKDFKPNVLPMRVTDEFSETPEGCGLAVSVYGCGVPCDETFRSQSGVSVGVTLHRWDGLGVLADGTLCELAFASVGEEREAIKLHRPVTRKEASSFLLKASPLLAHVFGDPAA